MSDPLAGRAGVVKVNTSDSGYTTIGSIDSIDCDYGVVAMDASGMTDTAERRASSGWTKFTLNCSGKFNPSDSGQALVLANLLLYTEYLWDGTNGRKCLCAVEGLKIGSKQGAGPATISFSLVPAGGAAPTTVS